MANFKSKVHTNEDCKVLDSKPVLDASREEVDRLLSHNSPPV